MLQYRSFEEIVAHPGLRIVLVKGVPSPWGQAAKTIFEIKGLEYVAAPASDIRTRKAAQCDVALAARVRFFGRNILAVMDDDYFPAVARQRLFGNRIETMRHSPGKQQSQRNR